MIKNLKKNLALSATIIIITAISSVIISSISAGNFIFNYIFISNFVVGAVVLLAGILQFLKPIWLKKSNLIDHTNYKEILIEKREEQKQKANEILIVGISIILITGIIEIIIYFL